MSFKTTWAICGASSTSVQMKKPPEGGL